MTETTVIKAAKLFSAPRRREIMEPRGFRADFDTKKVPLAYKVRKVGRKSLLNKFLYFLSNCLPDLSFWRGGKRLKYVMRRQVPVIPRHSKWK